jgi:hypothetical protein
MFTIFNENYYIDIDRVVEECELEPSTGETQIHLIKYETVKFMLETIMSEVENVDENLGMKASGLSPQFKLAFNTLLNKKIINKY